MRSKARIFLLQSRYAALLNGGTVVSNLDALGFSGLFDPETREWIRGISEAAVRNSEDISLKIETALSNWSIDRLSIVTRLLLEQAVAEAFHVGTPAPVVIRESVRIAEEFDQPGAGAFVNGVLHRILIGNGGQSPENSADK
jgi:transcription antitermination factor NusB